MTVFQQHFIFEEDTSHPDEILLAYLPKYPSHNYGELLDILSQVIDNLSIQHGYFTTLSAMEEAIEKARMYTGQVKSSDTPLHKLNEREVA